MGFRQADRDMPRMQHQKNELEQLIAERKRMVARDLIEEAFDRGQEAGVDAEILADTFVYCAIELLQESRGAGIAGSLLEKYSRMSEEGRLPGAVRLQ
jgi:hypothetical protein